MEDNTIVGINIAKNTTHNKLSRRAGRLDTFSLRLLKGSTTYKLAYVPNLQLWGPFYVLNREGANSAVSAPKIVLG